VEFQLIDVISMDNNKVGISSMSIHPFDFERLSRSDLGVRHIGQWWLAWSVGGSSRRTREGVDPVVSRSNGEDQEEGKSQSWISREEEWEDKENSE
jgi:hypothetical protein